MVKCGPKWDALGVPEWTKLPQYQEQAAAPHRMEDVEMEGVEVAMEQKLVLQKGLRRKRSRADSMFTSTIESPVKRAKVPGVKGAQTEQIPTVHKYFTVSIKHNTTKNGRTKFRVDREKALRSASGFVTAALLQISFSEPIDLTHEDPSIVKSYLTWINTGKVSNQKQPRWFSSDKKVKHLALCYGLGERLQDVKYRNDILCKIQYHVVAEGLFPSDSAVAIIYENTKRGSPARQMMVDFWAYEGSEDWLQSKSIRSAIHLEFLEDLVPALLRLRKNPVGESRPWVDIADAYLVEE